MLSWCSGCPSMIYDIYAIYDLMFKNQETNDSFRRASSPPFQKPSATVANPTSWVNGKWFTASLLQLISNGTFYRNQRHLRSQNSWALWYFCWPYSILTFWLLNDPYSWLIMTHHDFADPSPTHLTHQYEHRIFIHSLDDLQRLREGILAMKVKNRCQLLPNESPWRLHIVIGHEDQAMWDLLQSKNHPRASTERAKIIALENGPFIDDSPSYKPTSYSSFSMAMLVIPRW